MKKLVPVFSLLLTALFVACQAKPTEPAAAEQVVYEATDQSLLSSGVIRQIEIIPLESPDPSALIGGFHQLVLSGDDFYAINFEGNARVLRFDGQGKFLNSIGSTGRGPQEYLAISDFSLDANGNPIIYSDQDEAAYFYQPDGTFVEKKELGNRFLKATNGYDGDTFLYLGFNNGTAPLRVLWVNKEGKAPMGYLWDESQVLMMSESTPVFTHYDEAIYVRESLNDTIYRITDRVFEPAYNFDFGAYTVPEEYFQKSDPMAAAEYLFAREFVSTRKFFENDKTVLLEAQIQKTNSAGEPQVIMTHGLKDKKSGEWSWFNAEVFLPTDDCITNYVQGLTDQNEIVCLVDPAKLLEYKDNPLFTNPEVLADITDASNFIVLKCKL
ncbi:MAG: 6-bladed beta-propeller [Rikenellaceae bacterium]|jgi:hypothetical protein|nr:6-bladed beta-propeller [Rikenellaceae bacterium]